jgi:hypothetical protein
MVKSSACEPPRRDSGSSVQFGFVAEVTRGFEETDIELMDTTGWKSLAMPNDKPLGLNRLRSTPPSVREAGTPFKPEVVQPLMDSGTEKKLTIIRAGCISIAVAWDCTLIFHHAGQKGLLAARRKI